MFKKNFFSFLLLAISGFVFANNTPSLIPPSSKSTESFVSCNLPAPESADYTELGSDWLVVRWVDLNLGVAHRVQTYTVNGNVLVSNLVAPSGTMSIKITGLLPGVSYYTSVCAICPDGSDSPNHAFTGPETTIVAELCVMSFSNPNSSSSCTIDTTNEFCFFNLNGQNNYFRIRPVGNADPNLERNFAVLKFKGRLRAGVTSAEGNYLFRIDNNEPTPLGVQGIHFQIKTGNPPNPIAGFQLSEFIDNGVSKGKLTCEFMAEGYEIVRLASPSGFQAPPTQADRVNKSNDRSEKASTPLDKTASPNPFSETLEVFLPNASTEKISLQLFNLSGQRVLDRAFVGKQEKYSLPTADLSPGFYMLRIEADGVVQTLKVVKSE